MSQKVKFEIKRLDPRFPSFLFHFAMARDQYVLARVCFTTGLADTACVLAHQSIEAYAKSILRLFPAHYYFAPKDDPAQSTKTRVWGHNLNALLRIAINVCPVLNKILEESSFYDFLDNLTKAHVQMRFGEAGYEITGPVHILLDNVVGILDTAYLEAVKIGKALLGVPAPFQQEFLLDNTTFPSAMLSGEPLANYTLLPPKTT